MNTQPQADPSEEEIFKKNAEGEWMELIKTAVWAVAIALLIRSFLFEPFNIPSSSMKPTLMVGDYLFVSKYAYGYSRYSFPLGIVPIEGRIWATQPQRGDVIVFKLPSDTRTDYIKRVIGLPGDRIQVTSGRLYINGNMVPRRYMGTAVEEEPGGATRLTVYEETLPNGVRHRIYEESDESVLDDTKEYTVPAGHYFMMGDNRDNSQDSRVEALVGYVPLENLVGRAERLFFSTDGDARFWQVWKWPHSIRLSRILTSVRVHPSQ